MRTLQMGRERNAALVPPVTFVISTSRHCNLVHTAAQVLHLHKVVTHPSILHNLFTHRKRHIKKNWQVWNFITIYKILIAMQFSSSVVSTVKIQMALKVT